MNLHYENETFEERYARLSEKSDREDLVMFINACFAGTRQNEYYTDQFEQSVSIDFLHRYVMANYRRIYARVIAAGINHFNQALIVLNLLRAGAPRDPDQRREEGELIAAALRSLPANRVFGLLKSLQAQRVNNRRTRAVTKRYLEWRSEPAFDAVKYRNKYRAVAAHAHMNLPGELGAFLFQLKNTKSYETDIFDKYRAAHFSASAIYDLPFTVAESLIQKHNIARNVFLEKIQHKMTSAEKLRYQSTAAKTKGARLDFDLGRAPLTKLVLYVLSLPMSERIERAESLHVAIKKAAARSQAKSPLRLGRVAAVLDRSRSSKGSRQKRNRPLAVAIASSYLLADAATEYRSFWTPEKPKWLEGKERFDFLIDAEGQTCLADPIIDALEWRPDVLVIVSDGYENDPPMAANQVLSVYRDKLCGGKMPEVIHMNPVFDSDHFSPRPLSRRPADGAFEASNKPIIATVGLRDAEDIATISGFARFASGAASLTELEDYLAARMNKLLGNQ